MDRNSCVVCQIAKENHSSVIYQDHQVILWANTEVDLPGYCIIAPIRHITRYHELENIEAQELFQITKKVSMLLIEKLSAEKVYQCCFSELTPHLHFHLFPRYSWMKNIAEVKINGGIDGPKLFTFIRENFIFPAASDKKILLEKSVNEFRSWFHSGD